MSYDMVQWWVIVIHEGRRKYVKQQDNVLINCWMTLISTEFRKLTMQCHCMHISLESASHSFQYASTFLPNLRPNSPQQPCVNSLLHFSVFPHFTRASSSPSLSLFLPSKHSFPHPLWTQNLPVPQVFPAIDCSYPSNPTNFGLALYNFSYSMGFVFAYSFH